MLSLVVTLLCGLLAAVVVGATDERRLAFTLGVQPGGPITVPAGGRVCQTPIDVAAPFRLIALETIAARKRARRGTPELQLVVETVAGRRVIGRGVVPPGPLDRGPQHVRLDRSVAAGQRVAVCVANRSTRAAAVRGNAGVSTRDSAATSNGRPQNLDLALVFEREQRASFWTLLPDIFSRAADFKLHWFGAWTFWLLLAAVTIAVPLMLGRALADAAGDEHDRDQRP